VVRGREIIPDQSIREIKAHDGHPGEHGDGGEVSKVSDNCAWYSLKASIKNCDEEKSYEGDADHVADDNTSMEGVEFWDIPIDNKYEEQGSKTDHSSASEDIQDIVQPQPVIVCWTLNKNHG